MRPCSTVIVGGASALGSLTQNSPAAVDSPGSIGGTASVQVLQTERRLPRLRTMRAGALRAKPVADQSLADLRPDLAAQWHRTKNGALRPQDVKPGSHKVAWWIGSCAHEWKTAIENRTAGKGCPRCARARKK